MIVARYRGIAKPFSPGEVHLASTLLKMAGNTLRRARLNEDLGRQVEQLQSLTR